MALIKCKECSKEISTTAASCPHCGAVRFVPKAKAKTSGCAWVLLIALGVPFVIIAMMTANAPVMRSSVDSPVAQQKPEPGELAVPSDPKARFYVLEKGGSGSQRTIVTKRVGPSGTSYSKRLYDCAAHKVKYLGTGDSLAAMTASKADPNMAPIVEGAIAYYVGIEACR